MEDLARFGFDLRIYFGRLCGCEELQNTFRDPRIDPEHFQRCDDSIAAKNGTEPGHARVGVILLGIPQRHHLDVGGRAADPSVESIVGTGNGAHAGRVRLKLTLGGDHGAGVTDGRFRSARTARHDQMHCGGLFWAQRDFKAQRGRRDSSRTGVTLNSCLPENVIQAFVGQKNRIAPNAIFQLCVLFFRGACLALRKYRRNQRQSPPGTEYLPGHAHN